MTDMRRKDRALSEEEAQALLDRTEYGVLSTVGGDGRPYGVPLNYCVIGRAVYFHCAVEGQKLEHLKNNRAVSFCVVGDTHLIPEKFSTRYESAIVTGEAEEVFGSVKQAALEGLIRKYSPSRFEEGLAYIARAQSQTRVFRITISRLTGKARK